MKARSLFILLSASALWVLGGCTWPCGDETPAVATYPLLTDAQKAYLDLPQAARRERFADAKFRAKEMGLPVDACPGCGPRQAYWPKPVPLSWAAASGRVYRVTVRDVRKDEIVHSAVVTGGVACVDNLEIAAEYVWTADDGDRAATGRFRTEDHAPRLVRFPGVPNVRDLGGRIGLNGRRVRQGLVFRSAGLNENAGRGYYAFEELAAAGKMPEYEKLRAAAESRLRQLERWLAEPSGLDPKDAEYREWRGRHKKDPAEMFLKSRIARVKDKIARKDFKVEKGPVAGKTRVAGENGAYIRRRFGIRSDIDLRTAGECRGMTGSPLGDSVTWFHCSSPAYGGMQGKGGRKVFAKIFRIFLDRRNYPIDFHCIAGQDRTGSIAFMLNALLGVEEDELYRDWETTGFWNRSAGFCHARLFDKLVDGFRKNYPAPTIRESVEKYVLDSGLTAADIETFRSIMLEE